MPYETHISAMNLFFLAKIILFERTEHLDLTSNLTRASMIAQLVKNLPAMQETPVRFLGQEDPLEKVDRLPTPVFLGFLCGSAGKESACNVGDLGSIPGLGRYPGEGKGKATHSNILAWRIPGAEQSMGSQRVQHD